MTDVRRHGCAWHLRYQVDADAVRIERVP